MVGVAWSPTAVQPSPPQALQGEGSIRISDLLADGDLNKDGKIDAFERRALAAIKAADTDNSGHLTRQEFVSVMRSLVESDKAKNAYKKFVVLLFAIILVMAGAILGVSLGANELSKESHVKGNAMVTLSGATVRTGSIVSFASIWELPKFSTNVLRELKSLSVYLTPVIAGTGLASEGELEATLQITSALKPSGSETKAYFTTANGALIVIDGALSSGTLTKADGTVFTIGATASARKLAGEADAPAEPQLWPDEETLVASHDIVLGRRHLTDAEVDALDEKTRRRLCSSYSGSFTQRSSTGTWRKLMYGCTLMTSGSFTNSPSTGTW